MIRSADLRTILDQMYLAFNRRDVAAILPLLSDDIVWANGLEGGHLYGPAEIEDYWRRQWLQLSPVVIPLAYRLRGDRTMEACVRQIVITLECKLQSDSVINHVFTFDSQAIRRFDIEV